MLKKLLVIAAGLALSVPVLADGRHKDHGRHFTPPGHHFKHHGHSRPVVIMPPPRVYYAPRPRVVYAPPAPVYYAPAPVYRAPIPSSGVSIRLHLPL